MDIDMNKQVRELQKIGIEILEDFSEFCEANHLTFYLSSGTLLGAVRHKGFIPWDDDIDVAMPWDDYKVFCELSQEQMGEKYFIQNCATDDNYYLPYTKIRVNNTTFMDRYLMCQGIHLGVWMDVFPIIETNPGLEFKLKDKIVQYSGVLQIGTLVAGHVEDFEKQIGVARVKLVLLISKLPLKFRKSLHVWILNKVFSSKNRKCVTEVYVKILELYTKQVFDGNPVKVTYEGRDYNAPSGYDEYLHILYGDYMQFPPEDKRIAHLGDAIIDLERDYSYYLQEMRE